MPLWDTLLSAGMQALPAITQALQGGGGGGGSPMFPGMAPSFAGGPAFSAPMGAMGRRGGPKLIDPRTGKPFKTRRGTGLSARDIRGAQKVARLVQHFGYRPKIKARKRRR